MLSIAIVLLRGEIAINILHWMLNFSVNKLIKIKISSSVVTKNDGGIFSLAILQHPVFDVACERIPNLFIFLCKCSVFKDAG